MNYTVAWEKKPTVCSTVKTCDNIFAYLYTQEFLMRNKNRCRFMEYENNKLYL